ncbi:MAG: agmatine deiminase [Bacteroidetes bacterium HLUCCA01]|nr:MAG: agmatine deiminase [Bacteroidetes bacterium HLUCCA01]
MFKSLLKFARWIPLLLVGCGGSSGSVDGLEVVRQAAEFEDQQATWISWPLIDHKQGLSNEAVVLEMIAVLTEAGQQVRIAIPDSAALQLARSTVQREISQPEQVKYFVVDHYEWWIRDTGPAFVETADGGRAVVNFRFNAWGYADADDPDVQSDAALARNLARQLGYPVIESQMISEGGNREVNGRGTLMLSAATEENRNPDMSREEMEAEFARVLGVSNVIWLEEGLYEDDHTFMGPKTLADGSKAYTVVTTLGHIDEFARFADERTILLAQVPEEDLDDDPIARENHRRLEVNYEILRNATDQDGNPFRIVRVPLNRKLLFTMEPGDYVYDLISTLDYLDGSVFPVGEPIQVIAAASYLNVTITPNVILGQKFGTPDDPVNTQRDAEVQRIMEEVFPGRTVVMIDPVAVNLGGGGLHCVTLHHPR